MKRVELNLIDYLEPTLVQNFQANDIRGSFNKLTNLNKLNLDIEAGNAEIFWTISRKATIRGLHFQDKPFEQNKIVTCIKGKIFDVVLDYRPGSTYGKIHTFTLSDENRNSLFVPKGFAHGFQSLEDDSTVLYIVDNAYSPQHDRGYLWNSIKVNWPLPPSVISIRDQAFDSFA